jgi:hypothetical protein
MTGPIYRLLAEDHRRLEALLTQAAAGPEALGTDAYSEFRAGLLRHIGMEENILIPEAHRARGGHLLPIAAKLRLDHGALAALLVPPPSLEVIAAIRAILFDHDLLEEGSGGLYETCEKLVGDDAEALLEKLRKAPSPQLRPHVSNLRVLEAIRQALARAGYNWDELASKPRKP